MRGVVFLSLLALVLAGLAFVLLGSGSDRLSAGSGDPDGESGSVRQVTDGDTLVVSMSGREERVRLLGVDTPETGRSSSRPGEYLAAEATEFTRTAALARKVSLQRDPQRKDRDDYGRLLRYVMLPDGSCLNAELIRNGLGYAFTRYPFEREEQFIKLEAQARDAGIGLWADGGRAELIWNLDRGIEAVRLHPMTNRSWAIEYAGRIKPRVRSNRLISELNALRRLIERNEPAKRESLLREEGYLLESPDDRPTQGRQTR